MLQTHIDFSLDTTTLDIPTPVITMYGNLLDNTPIRVEVRDFLPYFYAQAVEGGNPKSSLTVAKEPVSKNDNLENNIEKALINNFTKGRCMGVQRLMRQSIYGYTEKESIFYKVLFNSPFCLRSAKAMMENGLNIVDNRGSRKIRFKIYESGFPYVLRFMNDLGITGMSYVIVQEYEILRNKKEEIVKSTFGKNSNHRCVMKSTMCISTSAALLKPLPLTGDYMKMLPLKILSFDIECVGAMDAFPVATKDPVIQIGNTIQRFGSTAMRKVIFCLKETAEIPGAEVHWFETEKEVLEAWMAFWHAEDPDIIIGYNIKGFDFPYLLDRAAILGIDRFPMLGRSKMASKVVSKQQSSSAFGSFDSKDVLMDGRLIFDLLHVIRRDHKLRSYSLNAVSFHFLREQKEDVSYTAMHSLQNGTKDTRRRIASYCLHDTLLPLRLFDKLNILINYSELSRATHVPIGFFSTRGSAIKVLSQIYAEAGPSGFLVPDMDPGSGTDGFEGAFVMEPLRGFYSEPIAVLDFSSLYPSIIISKNMCYTTLLSRSQASTVESVRSPTGDSFCTASVREGLLPRILRNLLSARAETKRQLADATDPFIRRSLDGRQLALKICANSIYGFTGSPTGQLLCLPISQSTTAFGRDMIAQTKSLIETNFCIANGYSCDTRVIYGDTDSVMVNFTNTKKNPGGHNSDDQKTSLDKEKSPDRSGGSLVWVFNAAKEISKFVSSTFEKPVSLEFEKVYYPYLLMNKKRYAGLIFTNPEKADRIDTKGIETVRRDNCELVKDVIQTCLTRILIDRNVESAVSYVKETVQRLYTEKIDLSRLVISKTYTKTTYANKQTHSELAERLKKRGLPVGIGDRIPYVIVKGDKKSLACEKSEDPVFVLENNLPIDKDYYIEQQLSKPVHRLFEPIMDNVSSLFYGEHTTVISQNVSVNGPMNAFVKTLEECVGCRKPGCILCSSCSGEFLRHYITLQRQFDEKAAQYNACWVQCQRCQGSIVNEVLCINRICPIWYKRTKIKKEITPLQLKIDKLRGLSW